jgi:hypothetical protein
MENNMFHDLISLSQANAAEYERMVQRLMLERRAIAAEAAEKRASRQRRHTSGYFGWFPKLHRSA